MKASGDYFPRLKGLFFTLSVLALFVIGGGLVIADGTAVLEGLELDTNNDGQSLSILLSGKVDYQLNPLDGNKAIQITLPDCELGSLFTVPALKAGDFLKRIDYKLSLLKGVKSVTLIVTFRDGLLDGGSYSVEETGNNIVLALLETEPVELLVSPYGSGTSETLIEGIEVIKLDGEETVEVRISSPCEPKVRTRGFPFSVILEYDDVQVSEELENDYPYESDSGLIREVAVTRTGNGNIQVAIIAPDAGRYVADEEGSDHSVTIYSLGGNMLTEVSEPAEVDAPVLMEETPVPGEEIPMAEDKPFTYPKPMDYGSIELVGEVSDYPDLPVVTEDYEEGSYYFPGEEPSRDKKHISDAIVSLNFENASFIDVMMILASQAGVDFVLDAYWNSSPTGHIRERPPGGPGGSGGFGGGLGSGGSFAPVGGRGSVTLQVTNRTFDEVFQMLMLQNSLDFEVFRASPEADPIVFISTRERLQQEMGLGVINIYQVHYVDPSSAFDFLQTMDLIPSTSGYGYWYYGGGGGNSGGNSGGSGGSSGGGGSRGGGSSGGGGGIGFSAPGSNGGSFTNPVSAMDPFNVLDAYPSMNLGAGMPVPEPYQQGGQGGGGQGGQGGGGDNGGGIYTAKAGAIGIMATTEMHEIIKDALDQIDKPPKQIFVETTFLSVDVNPEQRPDVYGVDNLGDWAYQYGDDRFRFSFDAVNNEGIVFEVLPKNQQVPYEDFRARYKWLYFDRKVKIVSSPRVAVIEGYTGSVNVTENRPFIIDGGVIIDQFGNPIPAPDQVTFVPTGTTLSITPYIDDFGNITMFLNPTNSSLLGEPQLIEGNLVFGTVNTSVNTILRLRDGETIVLGGMTQNSEDIEKQMIPFLGELPIIGVLFGRTERQKIDSQLVILLTTHIVGS